MLHVNSLTHNIFIETSVSHSPVPHSLVLGGRLNHNWMILYFHLRSKQFVQHDSSSYSRL